MTSENEIGVLLSVAVPPVTRWRSEAPITFDKQRFLVIDDQPASRQSLRISILAMGVFPSALSPARMRLCTRFPTAICLRSSSATMTWEKAAMASSSLRKYESEN
ncbi:protein of unknown function [Georgfuchsia toluolica]|uniref:Uncharacterized protein n=1 Tax=Georgfuchsia toluolica TaxID=424218 RepID=A0A916J1Z3_9PROT|nr:hypothetical protein [Georgfuchsia toluolica]CAG4882670.1 protein of unknown function [Georgfuchsia toluolica]